MTKLEAYFIIAFISVPFIYCATLVPERANVTEVNKDYVKYARMYISRTSRKSPYFINLEGWTKYTFGNNVTGNAYFFEYLHNEYRPSFVEIHSPLCDFIHKDILIGKMLATTGFDCPLPAGEHWFQNMTVPLQDFPFKFPFSKFRVEYDLRITNSGIVLGKGYLNGVIKN